MDMINIKKNNLNQQIVIFNNAVIFTSIIDRSLHDKSGCTSRPHSGSVNMSYEQGDGPVVKI